MAGLPCDSCGEETVVIPSGIVAEDGEGRLIYRRYRACVNSTCPVYRHRRETVEIYLPPPETPILVDTLQLRQYLSVPLVSESQPSLFDTSSGISPETQKSSQMSITDCP